MDIQNNKTQIVLRVIVGIFGLLTIALITFKIYINDIQMMKFLFYIICLIMCGYFALTGKNPIFKFKK